MYFGCQFLTSLNCVYSFDVFSVVCGLRAVACLVMFRCQFQNDACSVSSPCNMFAISYLFMTMKLIQVYVNICTDCVENLIFNVHCFTVSNGERIRNKIMEFPFPKSGFLYTKRLFVATYFINTNKKIGELDSANALAH